MGKEIIKGAIGRNGYKEQRILIEGYYKILNMVILYTRSQHTVTDYTSN